jgi:uncharacterized membrane protein YeaQ/YmgE (transglycosylase-associated protein family)
MSATYILWYLIIGLIAGLAAGRVIRDHGLGLTGNLVIGIAGALIGGYLGTVVKIVAQSGTLGAVLAALIGAVAALGVIAWLKNLSLTR